MTNHLPNQDAESSTPPTTLAQGGESGLLWLHVIFFCMGLSVIALSFLMQASGQTSVYLPGASFPMPELCTAKRVFGIPCPGCGLTRSFISISHGEFGRAWGFNPAGFLLYSFVFVQIPWNAMQYWLIRRRGYGAQVPYIHFLPIAIVTILTLQWLVKLPQMF